MVTLCLNYIGLIPLAETDRTERMKRQREESCTLEKMRKRNSSNERLHGANRGFGSQRDVAICWTEHGGDMLKSILFI